MAFQTQILDFATSQNWAALATNMILSTIVGGIVIIVLIAIISRAFRESVKLPNAFLMVLIISAITHFGVLAFITPVVPIPSLVIILLLWVGLTKVFFSEMVWWHAILAGLVGFALSITIVPTLTVFISSMVPAF